MSYKTDNFYLSVWLLSRGYAPTVEWNDDNKGKASFVFDELTEEDVELHKQEFHQDEVVQEFIQGIRKLKDLLYQDKNPVVYDN